MKMQKEDKDIMIEIIEWMKTLSDEDLKEFLDKVYDRR
jgi:hypothetical protein